MHLLHNPIRHYAWGSRTAIAELLDREPSGHPEAEMWIGAHPNSPSIALLPDGTTIPQDELVTGDPDTILGPDVVRRFGTRLPFLAKLLAADQALPLQVHPTRTQAEAGYAAEQQTGVPARAAHRNFKDPNHKPEMIIALSPFQALCGFRDPHSATGLYLELARYFSRAGKPVPAALAEVIERLSLPSPGESLKAAFTYPLGGGSAITQAVAAIAELFPTKPVPADPALAAVAELAATYPEDPGVLVSILLNHVALEPGQALVLPAGKIHAYVKGLGFEVMAASDNVLRGGLTTKHIDIPLLLDTVDFDPVRVPPLQPEAPSPSTLRWKPPFEEFQVEKISFPSAGGQPVELGQNGPVVVIVIQGAVRITSAGGRGRLQTGNALLIPAAASRATIAPDATNQGPALAFAVTVGDPLQ